ncbi:MAG TPA: choice-of-anchor D domain-containing protein [Candidatus Paceibacterota bacterium]|nr:choice-of-anchor D domain-containing protein [Candidatus Paceibacterota bacterium]
MNTNRIRPGFGACLKTPLDAAFAKKALACALFGLTLAATGATSIGGAKSGTLTLSESPYLVTSDLYVSPGQTLTIEAGVVLEFKNPDIALVVDGILIAKGTEMRPIRFTSDETNKQPGQWEAIIFRDSSVDAETLLEHCTIEAAGAAGFANENIRTEYASPTIRNCLVRLSRGNGLNILARSDPTVENCRFEDNGLYAVGMSLDSFPRLTGNSAINNGQNAIGIQGGWTSRSGIWTRDNLPYVVMDYVGVSRDRSLTIEAGVRLQFRNVTSSLTIDGTLTAQGTAENPILFTSDEPAKAPGQWLAIVFRDSSVDANTRLEHCVIEAGGGAPGAANETVRCETASPTFSHCLFRGSRAHGLTLWSSQARIEQCQFVNNAALAISMDVHSFPILQNNTAAGNGQNAIGVLPGWTSRSGAWTKDNLPYLITDYIGVSRGHILTNAPGIVVLFEDPTSALVVDGALVAAGTESQPIHYTSDEAAKQPGQWRCIEFRDSSDDTVSVLSHCLVEYGGQGVDGSVILTLASPRIMASTIRFSQNDGLFINNSFSPLDQVRFLNNSRDGLRSWNRSKPILTSCTFQGNGGYGINHFDTSAALSAENNYWGHLNGPKDDADKDGLRLTNPGGLGDKVSEYVDWSPYRTTDPTSGYALPEIHVSPLDLEFGAVNLGQQADLSLVVSNRGGAPLILNSASLDNPQFQVLATWPLSIGAGSSQTLTVRFAPTIPGAQWAQLSLGNNDPAFSTVRVSLFGASGNQSGLRGEFWQFTNALYVMPSVRGRAPDYTGAFAKIQFPETTQAFTNVDGVIPRTPQGKEFLDDFAARLTGSIHVTVPGDYVFAVGSDDGAMLKINGRMVVEQNATGAFRTGYGAINLAAGAWPVELDFFERNVVAGLSLKFTGPGPIALTTNGSPSSIEVQVASDYVTTAFYEGIGFPIGLTFSSGGIWGVSLLAGDGEACGGFGDIIKIDASGMATSITTAIKAPNSLLVDSGGGFGGDLLVLDDYLPGDSLPPPGNRSIGSDRLKRVKSDGTPSEIATVLGGNAMAWGRGSFGSDLFVSDSYAQRILQVKTDGKITDFLGGKTFSGLAITDDPVFGNTAYSGESIGRNLLKIGADAKFSLLSSNLPVPICLAQDQTGRFGNDLFMSAFVPDQPDGTIATRAKGVIYRIKPDGAMTEFATGLFFRSFFSADLAFGFGGDLFVLEDGRSRILRFSPGTTSVPSIQASPPSLSFGTITLDQTKELQLTIANAGSGSLVINTIAIDNPSFTFTQVPLPITLSPQGTTQLTIRFRPTSAATANGTLAIASNDPQQPSLAVALSGAGYDPGPAPRPIIQVSPSSLDFGSVLIGQNKTLILIVQNPGTAALTVTALTSDNPLFQIVAQPIPFSVLPDSSTSISVRFAPSAATGAAGRLSIASNDPSQPSLNVNLQGVGASSGGIQPLPPNLVAWWPAEGDGQDVWGEHDGVLQNGTSFIQGKVGQAFSLDGLNDYVSTPLDVQPGTMPSTTWETWIYPVKTQGRQQILSSDDGRFGRSVMLEGSRFGVFTGLGVWVTETAILLNQWQHVAVIFTPNNVEFYHNGVRFISNIIPYGQATNRLHIGRNPGPGFGEFFQGRIDEVSIYDRALTPEEIQSIYAADSNGKSREKPLVNLLLNPGAEEGPASSTGLEVVAIPGWITTGNFTVGKYGSPGFPGVSESQRITGGSQLFFGGPGNAFSSAIQTVDLYAWSADIDGGRAEAVLQAQLGSAGKQGDSATVQAIFRNAQGIALGGLSIGPVAGTTNLLRLEKGSSAIPAGTRTIEVQILAMRAEDLNIDVYVDNVVLGLKGVSSPAPRLSVIRQGQQIILSWPASAADFRLQTTDNVRPPITWLPVLSSPTLTGDQCLLPIDVSDKMRYYRLVRGP